MLLNICANFFCTLFEVSCFSNVGTEFFLLACQPDKSVIRAANGFSGCMKKGTSDESARAAPLTPPPNSWLLPYQPVEPVALLTSEGLCLSTWVRCCPLYLAAAGGVGTHLSLINACVDLGH